MEHFIYADMDDKTEEEKNIMREMEDKWIKEYR